MVDEDTEWKDERNEANDNVSVKINLSIEWTKEVARLTHIRLRQTLSEAKVRSTQFSLPFRCFLFVFQFFKQGHQQR